MASKELHPETLIEDHDKKYGYCWTIKSDGDNSEIEVAHCKPDIMVRQENDEVTADILMLSHGQAYDLLKALSRALETKH